MYIESLLFKEKKRTINQVHEAFINLKERRQKRLEEYRNILLNSIKPNLEKHFKETKETSKIFWHSEKRGIQFQLTFDGSITSQTVGYDLIFGKKKDERKVIIRDFNISQTLQTKEEADMIKEYLKVQHLCMNQQLYITTKQTLEDKVTEKLRKEIDYRFGNDNSFITINIDGYKYPVKIILTYGSCLNFEFNFDQDDIKEINI
jgi:hypothetical protein